MPKITKGGVSNRLLDETFMAAPGTPVEKALDEGLEDVGRPSSEQPSKQDEGADTEPDTKADDNRVTAAQEPEKPDTPVDGPAPAKKAAPRKATIKP